MKKNVFLWIFVILIVGGCVFLSIFINGRNKSASNENVLKEYEVSTQTIRYELTGAGELETGESQTIYLNTDKKFKLTCVEVQDVVEKGQPLIQYTDGSYLKAPFDCVVTALSIPTASSKVTSANYVTVYAVDTLILSINVSEADIEQVSVGQEVQIIPNKDETMTYLGQIAYISGVATRSNGFNQFEAKISFENDGQLKVGMSATCSILLNQSVDAIVVPVEAVYEKDLAYYVDVKNGNTTVQTQVTIGLSNADVVEILSGLEVGQIVVYGGR